jgi:triosephosphate isomerase (TIM)
MRIPVIAGNWKMYKGIAESIKFIHEIKKNTFPPSTVETIIFAPFTALSTLGPLIAESRMHLGAQNVHWEPEGAFTGEISVSMLQEIGVKYVIIGHSERRIYFGETDKSVNQKVKATFAGGLIPIVCVGETLKERENGQTKNVVQMQLRRGWEDIPAANMQAGIIAYEPIWAIGTGKSSTADHAEEVIHFIRETITDLYDAQIGNRVRIQYGGSVKPENIQNYLSQPNIDGALVGGASLDPQSFKSIIQAAHIGEAE